MVVLAFPGGDLPDEAISIVDTAVEAWVRRTPSSISTMFEWARMLVELDLVEDPVGLWGGKGPEERSRGVG